MVRRLNEDSFGYWIKGDTFSMKKKIDTEVFFQVEEALENFKEVIYQ